MQQYHEVPKAQAKRPAPAAPPGMPDLRTLGVKAKAPAVAKPAAPAAAPSETTVETPADPAHGDDSDPAWPMPEAGPSARGLRTRIERGSSETTKK